MTVFNSGIFFSILKNVSSDVLLVLFLQEKAANFKYLQTMFKREYRQRTWFNSYKFMMMCLALDDELYCATSQLGIIVIHWRITDVSLCSVCSLLTVQAKTFKKKKKQIILLCLSSMYCLWKYTTKKNISIMLNPWKKIFVQIYLVHQLDMPDLRCGYFEVFIQVPIAE